MTVAPSIVIALWSDGPAPPRRLSTPAVGSTRRTPKDCNSLINRSVGSDIGAAGAIIRFIGPGRGCGGGGSGRLYQGGYAGVVDPAGQLWLGVTSGRVRL